MVLLKANTNEVVDIVKKKKKKYLVFKNTYALQIFFTLSIFNVFQFGVGLSGVLMAIFLFLLFFIMEKRSITIDINHILIFLFWICTAISTLLSNVVAPERDIITLLIFVLFFIFSTGVMYGKEEIKLLLNTLILLACLASLNIIWNFLNDFTYGWQRYSLSVLHVYRDPNYVSAFLTPAVAIIIYSLLMYKKKLKRKITLIIALLLIVSGILTTGSRAAFITVLLTMSLTVFFNIISVRNYQKLLKIIFYLLLMVLAWLFVKSFLPEFILFRIIDFDSYTDDSRLLLWKEALRFYGDSPLFGSGMNASSKFLFTIGLYNSHNIYIDLLIDNGLIGFLLIMLAIIRFLIVKKGDRTLLMLVVTSCFFPLFFINGFNTASFWAPLILCQILSNYSRKNTKGLIGLLNEFNEEDEFMSGNE